MRILRKEQFCSLPAALTAIAIMTIVSDTLGFINNRPAVFRWGRFIEGE